MGNFDLHNLPDQIVAVVATFVLCLLLGVERQFHQKNAGVKTHVLVGLGSCLFTLVSAYGFTPPDAAGLDRSRIAAQIVSAVWQAKAYHAIEERLTERERGIFRRGRNAKSHAPRRASVAEYHASTGFEALLGTLFLEKDTERLDEIAEWAFQAIAQGMMAEIAAKRGRRVKKGAAE